MLACSVQLYGLYLVKGAETMDEVMFFVIEQGPSSKRSPVEDEQPGPPFSQRSYSNNTMVRVLSIPGWANGKLTRGAVSGFLRASKNL